MNGVQTNGSGCERDKDREREKEREKERERGGGNGMNGNVPWTARKSSISVQRKSRYCECHLYD